MNYSLVTVGALVLGILAASGMDASDALDKQGRYCDMVESGAWPDYRGTYDSGCQSSTSGNEVARGR